MIYLTQEQKQRICDTLKIAECDMGLFCEAVTTVGRELDFQNDCCSAEDMEKIKAYIESKKTES